MKIGEQVIDKVSGIRGELVSLNVVRSTIRTEHGSRRMVATSRLVLVRRTNAQNPIRARAVPQYVREVSKPTEVSAGLAVTAIHVIGQLPVSSRRAAVLGLIDRLGLYDHELRKTNLSK